MKSFKYSKIIIIFFLILWFVISFSNIYSEEKKNIKIPGDINWGDDISKLKKEIHRKYFSWLDVLYLYVEINKDIGKYEYRADKNTKSIYQLWIEILLTDKLKPTGNYNRFIKVLKKLRNKYGHPKRKKEVSSYCLYGKVQLYWEDDDTILYISYCRSGNNKIPPVEDPVMIYVSKKYADQDDIDFILDEFKEEPVKSSENDF